MEFLAFLLVIVFTVISMSKNKKQGSAAAKPGASTNNGRRPAKEAPARAKQPAAPAETEIVIPTDLDEIIADVKSRISGERTVAKRRSEPVVKAMKRSGTVQGASMLEDADCAGGSMAQPHA